MKLMDSFAGLRLPAALTDTSLAALVAAGCLALPGMIPPGGPDLLGPDARWFALVLLSTLSIALHHRLPWASPLVVAAATSTLQGLSYIPDLSGPEGTSIGPAYLGVAVAVFLTSVRCEPRITTATALLIPVHAFAEALLASAGNRVAAFLTDALLLLAAWALGLLMRARTAMRNEALERAAALEREQTANARAAVMAERARIAREMHDIVAHNVSLMVVQTIAADRVQDRSPGKAHELHATIEQTGRDTVTELRRLLSVLRTDEDADDDPTRQPPQPTVDALPELIDSVRATGLDVDHRVTGTPVALPAGTHLTVYRVVQEALTNTLKHAGPTRTGVSLDWDGDGDGDGDRLVVRVCDDGPRDDARPHRPPTAPAGTGHGLLGMRERVSAVGGTLYAGARPGGGYCVHVTLPLPEPDETTAQHEGSPRYAAH
ncbi:sensor histidine kinase [Streptomyces sp. NPDC057052]|uniref:sensor histidine kinase n=1 Tax=Streptomyces sp. NPDC057052 TaxID=3346010 RepID=UPI0036305AA1